MAPLVFAWQPPRVQAVVGPIIQGSAQMTPPISNAAPRNHVAQAGTADGHPNARDRRYRVRTLVSPLPDF